MNRNSQAAFDDVNAELGFEAIDNVQDYLDATFTSTVEDTNCDPLDDLSDEEVQQEAERQSAADEPPEQRHKRLVDEFRRSLSGDAMAVPSLDQIQAMGTIGGYDFTVYDPRAFDEADFRIEYLIDNVLVETQPAGVAGPAKGCKTSTCVDMGVSLSSGTPFLNHYNVKDAKRVLFLSAESGMAAVRSTARRVCKARGLRLVDLPIHWGPWVPHAKIADKLAAVRGWIKHTSAEVVFIDPLYQAVDGADAAIVAGMGQQLKVICDQVLHFGATPIIVHHSTKTSPRVLQREPLEIHDMAGAGVSEFFRQWVLLNRREAFNPDGPHRLWLSCGGSAGHASQWALDIDEERDHDGPHGWRVDLLQGEEARQQAAEASAEKAEQSRAAKQQRTLEARRDDVLKAFVGQRYGLTKTDVCTRSGLNNANAGQALAMLIREGLIEECQIEKSGRKYDGFRRTSVQPDNSDNSDNF